MKINISCGDLTDNSAKKEGLFITPPDGLYDWTGCLCAGVGIPYFLEVK